jgi:plastocyanin
VSGAVVMSPGRLSILAACVGMLLATTVPGAAAEIVINAGALTPALLTVESDDSVTFVNRSGRVVHLEFRGRADEHHLFQVPGLIRATFHRAGLHPYVVHFETAPRAELQGVVEVREPASPRSQPPVCSGVSVGEVCLER